MRYDEADYRLWASVVLQSREDVETLPIGSADYTAAVAFLTSEAPYWRRGRDEVAAHLETTGEAIRRVGRTWVAARRRAEGLPETEPRPVRKVLEVKPAPQAAVPPAMPPRPIRWAQRRLPPERNPFSPYRKRLASVGGL